MTRSPAAMLLLAAHLLGQEGAAAPLKVQTLAPKERLALPHLLVPVGPEDALHLAGRPAPVMFRAEAGTLRADATSKPGFETEIVEGEPVAVELDGEAVAGVKPVRNVVFRKGRPEAGAPEWTVVVLDVLSGRIGGEAVSFVDHDADGTFLTPFRDFLVRKTGADLHPAAPQVILGRKVWSVVYDEARRELSASEDKAFVDPVIFPSWADVTKGLFHVNEIRGAMNLPPFGLHRVASHHAVLHARYCALNGYFGHVEEAGKQGYSPESARAGLNSIGSGQSSVAPAVDGFLTTLLHRMPLIDPRLCEIGIGADGSQVWIEFMSGERREWKDQGPVIFPGPDRSWNDGTFRNERPDPRPEGVLASVGLPVTCAWYGGEEILAAEAVLLDGKTPVECWRHDSALRELREMSDPEVKVCLMPKRPLKFHAYVLRLTWTGARRPCRLDYSFRIGKR